MPPSSTWRSTKTTNRRQIRPQLKTFHLETEPWLFAIDSKGTVVDVVEGAFGLEEMTRALEKATGEKSS